MPNQSPELFATQKKYEPLNPPGYGSIYKLLDVDFFLLANNLFPVLPKKFDEIIFSSPIDDIFFCSHEI